MKKMEKNILVSTCQKLPPYSTVHYNENRLSSRVTFEPRQKTAIPSDSNGHLLKTRLINQNLFRTFIYMYMRLYFIKIFIDLLKTCTTCVSSRDILNSSCPLYFHFLRQTFSLVHQFPALGTPHQNATTTNPFAICLALGNTSYVVERSLLCLQYLEKQQKIFLCRNYNYVYTVLGQHYI